MLWTLKDLINYTVDVKVSCYINNRWVPARPKYPFFFRRLKNAWMVATGKADAFIWPENG